MTSSEPWVFMSPQKPRGASVSPFGPVRFGSPTTTVVSRVQYTLTVNQSTAMLPVQPPVLARRARNADTLTKSFVRDHVPLATPHRSVGPPKV